MRHHHEEGRGPRGRHGDPSEHGDHGRRGGGRRQRFFGHGELRLIILDILSRSASHGYELIKEIETLTQGTTAPARGDLSDAGSAPDRWPYQRGRRQRTQENPYQRGRKTAARREPGAPAHIQERLQARMVGCELRRDPQMKRALENFKAVLDLKVNQQASSAAQLKQIIGIIDRAAMEISQLD